MDWFGIKKRRLQKARNEALHGVICSFFPDTTERKAYDETKQKMFDDEYALEIKREAKNMLEYESKDNFMPYICFNPKLMIYMLSDDETAKYRKCDVHTLIKNECDKLKESNYIQRPV